MTNYFFHAAVTLIVAINPLALAPLFIAVTNGFEEPAKRRIALTASFIAGGVLVAASFGGQWLLQAMGISISAFRIAGGLLLFVIAAEMLFDLRIRRETAAVKGGTPDTASVAAFPLAVPLIAGPGAISASIIVAERAPDTISLVSLSIIIVAIIVICLIIFLLSDEIDRVLGHTGQIVVTRLLGLLLAALSVEFVVDGVKAVVAGAPLP
jgi:multiple antibiotic resistance protein